MITCVVGHARRGWAEAELPVLRHEAAQLKLLAERISAADRLRAHRHSVAGGDQDSSDQHSTSTSINGINGVVVHDS